MMISLLELNYIPVNIKRGSIVFTVNNIMSALSINDCYIQYTTVLKEN